MAHMEIRSKVGADGVLALSIPLGVEQANRQVKVTVEPIEEKAEEDRRRRWLEFIDEIAGAWQGEPLTRPPQGDFERPTSWQ